MSNSRPRRPDTPEWAFPRALGAAIDYRGVEKQELAERMDVNPNQVTKWLGPDHNPTLKSMHDMAAALGMKLTITFTDPTVKLGHESNRREGQFEKALARLIGLVERGVVAANPHVLQTFKELIKRIGSDRSLVER